MLRLEFDPRAITLEAILAQFWASHGPTRRERSGQYRAILLCEDDSQLARCKASAAELEARAGKPVRTEIAIAPFHRAEDYHQKWKLRQRRALFEALAANYQDEASLLGSVAATKLNALVGGHLSAAQIARDLDRFGLPTHITNDLRGDVRSKRSA